MSKLPTICLNMIVKNESKIILRLLNSVLSIIDTYCICDTGCSDNTIGIIIDFFDKHNIKGKIIYKDFINFGINRDYSLQQAKNLAGYILFLDADMILEIGNNFNKQNLNKDIYYIKQGNDNFQYSNIRLVKTKNNIIKCIGVTHEYYDIKKIDNTMCTSENVNNQTLFINDIGDGGSKSDKYLRDIKLLEEGLINEPNNSRYLFYLANSYYDICDYNKAIENYKNYLNIENLWDEEKFYSLYKLGLSYKSIGNYNLMIETFLLAFDFRPSRLEPLYELINFFRINKKFNLCSLFYDKAKNIKYPDNDVLFVNKDIWDYKLLYEYSIFSYYIDKYLTVNEYHKLFNYLPNNLLTNVLENYKFYYKKIEHKKIKDISSKIYKNDEIFYSSTPSIIDIPNNFSKHFDNKTKYLMNLRFVNYSINQNTQEYIWNNKQIGTINRYLELDENYNIIKQNDFEFDINDNFYEGIEDIKLLQISDYNKKIIYTGTKPLNKNKITVCYGNYIILSMDNNKINYKKINYELYENKYEKNWVFIPKISDDKQKMIYKWYPLTIGELNKEKNKLENIKSYNVPNLFNFLRGSTNGYLYKNEIWFLCHLVINENIRYYYHIFVIFDENMKLLRYSIPIKFTDSKIEYSCGLIVNEEEVIISYSVMDNNSFIGVYNKKNINSLCN